MVLEPDVSTYLSPNCLQRLSADYESNSVFVLLLYIPVNSYGHVGTVSSPNHTFFLDKLEQVVNQCFMHILSLVIDNNPS